MRSSYFYFDAIRKKSIRFKKYSIFLPGSLFSGTGRVTLNLIARLAELWLAKNNYE
jgi:hypothetical protein